MKKLSLIVSFLYLLFFAVSCQKNMISPFSGAIEAGKVEEQPIFEPQKTGSASVPRAQTANPSPTIDSYGGVISPEPFDQQITTQSAIQLHEPDSERATIQEPYIGPETEPYIEEDNFDYDNLIPDEYKSLPYYYPEKVKRYVKYRMLNPDFGYDKVILYVNIGLDNPFYSNINTITEPDRVDILVNKYYKIPDNYEPVLEELPAGLCAEGSEKQYLRSDAKKAFEKMHRDAKDIGLIITAFGTYRNIGLQHDIWNYKVKSGKSIENVDRLNSRGGHSEHHTGLSVDVIKNSYVVEDTKEFEWYRENAHIYGFIIRYPKGKEHITGYQYEPWHLRYLGEDLAKAVYESGLTYEEYYALHIEPMMRNKSH